MSKVNTVLDILNYRLGFSKPRYINFIITKKCNSRCIFCNIWKKKKTKDIELNLIIKALNDPFLDGIRWIQLTGGEPFLRKDLAELVYFLTKRFNIPRIWIPTNGIATNLIVKCAKRFTDNVGVTVSLDGCEEAHNRMRGGKFFTHTLKTIKKLSRLENLKNLSISFTITSENYRDIEFVYNLAKSFGFDFSCRPANVSKIYYENPEMESKLNFPTEGIEYLKRFFNKIKNGRKQEFYFHCVLEYLKDPRNMILPCTASRNSFFLDEKLNVYPCLFLNIKLGNLLEQSAKDIWKSSKNKKVRNLIKNKKCPNCCVECETCRNIIYYMEKLL